MKMLEEPPCMACSSTAKVGYLSAAGIVLTNAFGFLGQVVGLNPILPLARAESVCPRAAGAPDHAPDL